jgi:four helix bundle protein
MATSSYRDLTVWQKAIQLVLLVYSITKHFPKEETYGLISQMRRCAVSIPSNIAEGKGRSSRKDMKVFLCHARGSVHELETQLLISQELGYLGEEEQKRVMSLVSEVARMLNGLISFAAA